MGIANLTLTRAEPLFGLDLGFSSLKVMQLETAAEKTPKVVGYGASGYSPTGAIQNGEIVDFATLSNTLQQTFDKHLIGAITTHRVACTLPTAHTFSRPMKLPKLDDERLTEAVKLEAEQYIPLPADKLYIDYEILWQDEQSLELLVVAAPRNIIDSYMKFLEMVKLEPVALEPTMNATARLFSMIEPSPISPALLIDFGSVSVDIAVFDKTIFVNSTVPGGIDTIINQIAQKLGVSQPDAFVIKNDYGIAYSDKLRAIGPVVKPMLDRLTHEIQKTIRYYEDRTNHRGKIAQAITFGGGATMRGLSDYLAKELQMPVRNLDPWDRMNFGSLKRPSGNDKSMYITVAGVAILSRKEIFS